MIDNNQISSYLILNKKKYSKFCASLKFQGGYKTIFKLIVKNTITNKGFLWNLYYMFSDCIQI